jgi:hypothetical protein
MNLYSTENTCFSFCTLGIINHLYLYTIAEDVFTKESTLCTKSPLNMQYEEVTIRMECAKV